MSLTLDAGSTDLNSLVIGDTFSIDVVLDRMNIVAGLTDLGATVFMPAGRFGGPSNELSGSIVPDPLDLFFTDSPGQSIDGLFSAFLSIDPNPNVVSNGTFFSFR